MPLCLGLTGCKLWDLFTGTHYDEGYVYVDPYTYYAESGYGSAPAVIKIWQQHFNGSSDSQADIHTWLSDNAGSFGGGWTLDGVGTNLMTAGLAHFGGFWPDYEEYDSTQTCNGGRNCFQQRIADIEKAMSDTHGPVIIPAYDSAYGVIKEYGGTRQCNIPGCRPSFDFMYLDVPGEGSGIYVTASNMVNVWSVNSDVHPVWLPCSVSCYGDVTNADWSDADDVALTYYGDPDPPDPQFSDEEAGGGEGTAPPIFSPARFSIFATPLEAMRTARAARANNLVVPNPTSNIDIMADILAGLRRTGLARHRTLQGFTLDDKRYRATEIVRVKSLESRQQDYYLVTFVDSLTKAPAYEVSLSVSGLLRALRLVPPSEHGRTVTTLDAATSLLRDRFGSLTSAPTLAYGRFGLGATEFRPYYVASRGAGQFLVATQDGRTYRAEATTSLAPAGQTLSTPRQSMRVVAVAANHR